MYFLLTQANKGCFQDPEKRSLYHDLTMKYYHVKAPWDGTGAAEGAGVHVRLQRLKLVKTEYG